MCTLSLVYDQWQPYIPYPSVPYDPNITVPNVPQVWPTWTAPYVAPPAPLVAPPFTDEELREMIDAFHAAVEAAKTLDRLTNQPDCEDPEKAALEDRVAELERRLDDVEDELVADSLYAAGLKT